VVWKSKRGFGTMLREVIICTGARSATPVNLLEQTIADLDGKLHFLCLSSMVLRSHGTVVLGLPRLAGDAAEATTLDDGGFPRYASARG